MSNDATSHESSSIDIFYKQPNLLFEIQKGFVPRDVLARLIKSEIGQEAYYAGWSSYLLVLGKNAHWRLTGNVEPDDFVSAMLTGHIPAKDAIQAQGGVMDAVKNYNPTRDNTRATICPDCGSSFWSYEHGNTMKCFKDWGVSEYRENRNECMPPVKVKGLKVCSHITSGPFPSQTAAQVVANGKEVIELQAQWYVICGHPIDLMSFQNYVHRFVMRPLKAEQKRFITAKTKGRSNNVVMFVCKYCNVADVFNEDLIDESSEEPTIDCLHCDRKNKVSSLDLFSKEKSAISLDAPLADDGKATVGDMLPTTKTSDVDLMNINNRIQELVGEFKDIIDEIVRNRVVDLEHKYRERLQTKIRQIERALTKATAKNDVSKIVELKSKLQKEHDSLVSDQNRIDYTKRLGEMYTLKYFGDENGEFYDYRQLTEKFMFKTLPYTQCNGCKHKMFELNETGKIEKDFLQSRKELKLRASLEEIPGYDRQHILATAEKDLFPHLGKFFHCTECAAVDITYYPPGSKNPNESRYEITPHIFQPAQRELTDLERDIFAYKLRCPQCAHENVVRPDKATGKLSAIKISKKIVDNGDGTRSAIREEVAHTCQRCNYTLDVEEDIVVASKEKGAYKIAQQLSELVTERTALITNASRTRAD